VLVHDKRDLLQGSSPTPRSVPLPLSWRLPSHLYLHLYLPELNPTNDLGLRRRAVPVVWVHGGGRPRGH